MWNIVALFSGLSVLAFPAPAPKHLGTKPAAQAEAAPHPRPVQELLPLPAPVFSGEGDGPGHVATYFFPGYNTSGAFCDAPRRAFAAMGIRAMAGGEDVHHLLQLEESRQGEVPWNPKNRFAPAPEMRITRDGRFIGIFDRLTQQPKIIEVGTGRELLESVATPGIELSMTMFREGEGDLLRLERASIEDGRRMAAKPRFALLDTKTGKLVSVPKDWDDVSGVTADGELLSVQRTSQHGILRRDGSAFYVGDDDFFVSFFPPAAAASNGSVVAAAISLRPGNERAIDIVDRRTGTLLRRIPTDKRGNIFQTQVSGDGSLLFLTYQVKSEKGGMTQRTEVIEIATGQTLPPLDGFDNKDVHVCGNGRVVTSQRGMPNPTNPQEVGVRVNVYDFAGQLLGDLPRGGNPENLRNELESRDVLRAYRAQLRAKAGHISRKMLEEAGKNRKAIPIPRTIAPLLDSAKEKDFLGSGDFAVREKASNDLRAYLDKIDSPTYRDLVREKLLALTNSADPEVVNRAAPLLKRTDARWASESEIQDRLKSQLLRQR